MCNLIMINLMILLLKLKVFDPGEVLYIYESVAGIGICVLRVIVSIVAEYMNSSYLLTYFFQYALRDCYSIHCRFICDCDENYDM